MLPSAGLKIEASSVGSIVFVAASLISSIVASGSAEKSKGILYNPVSLCLLKGKRRILFELYICLSNVVSPSPMLRQMFLTSAGVKALPFMITST